MKAPKPLTNEVAAYVAAKQKAETITAEALVIIRRKIAQTPPEDKTAGAALTSKLAAWEAVDQALKTAAVLIGGFAEMHRDYCDEYNAGNDRELLKAALKRAELRNKELYQQLKQRL